MSEEKFDFSSLYGASGFPHLKILVEVAKEQLEKGKPMETVLRESLEFAVSEAKLFHSQLVIAANKKVSEGLRELAFQKAWPNLGKAAEHALKLEEVVLEREGPRHEDIIDLTKLRKKILNTSISELGEMFKEDWLEENFPLLKERADQYKAEKSE